MADLPQLIQRWQAGEEPAAESLYNYCREEVFRLAYGLLGQRADAEEVTQDTLTYALLHIDRYDPQRAGFTTWLHTITVSRCRDRQRRKWLPRLSLTAWLKEGGDLPDPAAHHEDRLIRLEQHSQVWQAVQALKPALREAVILRYWADHTYQEIAAILGCPLPTAQSRVRLAYQQLRAALTYAEQTDPLAKERTK